jgi:hypothetical protein
MQKNAKNAKNAKMKKMQKMKKIEMQIVVNEKARHSQLTINREQ